MNRIVLRSMFVCMILMFSSLAFLFGGNIPQAMAGAASFPSNNALEGYITQAHNTQTGVTTYGAYTTSPLVGESYTSLGGGRYIIYTSRSFLSFDTSTIPAGAKILSATLFSYLSSKSFDPGWPANLQIYTSNYTTLGIGDWGGQSLFQGTLLTDASPVSAWYSSALSTTSLNLTGETQLSFKSNAETWYQVNARWTLGDASSAHPSRLEVQYMTAGTQISIQLISGVWLNSTAFPQIQSWNFTSDIWAYSISTVPSTKNVTIQKDSTMVFMGEVPKCSVVDSPTYTQLVNVYSSIVYQVWFAVPKGFSSPSYSAVHIALYNSFTGEGLPWEQMHVRICQGLSWNSTTAQDVFEPDIHLQTNANYIVRALDFFGNVLTSYSFATWTLDVFVPIPVQVYSWQVFNMNDQPVLMKIFWNNSGSPWEFFVGPRWQMERLLKGGNYTFETTFYGNNGTVGATVVYHRVIPMSGLNASFLFINGTTLSEIVSSVQGMKSTQEIITSLLTPSTVIIYEQLPVAPIKVMSLTLSLGLKLDPYMILQSTTYQNGTGATVNLWTPHPLLVGATYYVDSDTLSFSGSYTTHVWVNGTGMGGSNLLNSAILPATFNLLGQNVTVHGNKSLTVSRATTWREISSYTTNYYPAQHKYSMTLKLNDSTSLVYYTPYWFIGFPHNATIDQSTVTVFDVNNHLTLTKGSNFEVTAGGIHLTLSRLNASQNRTFTFTLWDANGTTGMGAPNLIAAAYSGSTLNGVPMQYSAVQWMNPWSSAYSGEMYVTLNFTGGDQLVSSSIVIVDQTTNRQLTTSDWVYTGRTIIILTSGVGTVGVGAGKNFGVYFTLGIPPTPTKTDFFFGPIIYGGQQVWIAGYAISWALVVIIAGWLGVALTYLKRKQQVQTPFIIMVSVTIILAAAMRVIG